MRNFQPRQPHNSQEDMWNTQLPITSTWGIYARQSTQAQLINNIQSTEMQTDDLIKWLIDKGANREHIALFDADLGQSGTLRIDQRTGLQELVERIQEDKVKAVLVYQVSRLFRDQTGVQYNVFADICKSHHCLLVTSDGMVFNFNNPMHLKMFRYLAEMAAEYIPQHIGMLHAMRLKKARKGLYAGLGTVSSGYIVDYRKDSPTYGKFIPYWPHAQVVHSFHERYYALEGNFSQLNKEMEAMPFVFPPFEPWVDQRNLARWKRRELSGGGYNLSRYGLVGLLTNPVYIGWWIVQGDVISKTNHERIISEEDEDLFWYAFNSLSEYTIKGEVNTYREEVQGPKRFYQDHTTDHNALLKGKISSPLGLAYVHVFKGKSHYAIIPKTPEKRKVIASEVDTVIIDTPFTKRFFELLQETHDFDEFQRWVTDQAQKQQSVLGNLTRQLEEIDTQQDAILTEIVDIRKQIKENAQTEEQRQQLEKEQQPFIDRLRTRFNNLEKPKAQLAEKVEELKQDKTLATLRKYADFQSEVKKLIPVWNKKPIEVRCEFVNLFVKQAVLTFASPHWIQLAIEWSHPAWGCDAFYIYRKRGLAPFWTEAEHETLKALYPMGTRNEILASLTTKSWSSIRAEALQIGVKRMVDVYQQPPTIPQFITWLDWQFMQEHGIALTDRSTKCERSSIWSTSNCTKIVRSS